MTLTLRRKCAFTLAEVLVTLSILGVVAAVTIPSIHRKWQDAYTVAAVRKAYAMFDNVFQIAIVENGKLNTWDFPVKEVNGGYKENSDYFGEQMLKYLKHSKFCKGSGMCFTPEPTASYCPKFSYSGNCRSWQYYSLNNSGNTGYYVDGDNARGKTILSNGMFVTYKLSSYTDLGRYSDNDYRNKSAGNYVQFDINGNKGPNRFGYDVFRFYFNRSGIFLIPLNTGGLPYQDHCKGWYGDYCSAWIIKKGNVDYKYRDVSSEW